MFGKYKYYYETTKGNLRNVILSNIEGTSREIFDSIVQHRSTLLLDIIINGINYTIANIHLQPKDYNGYTGNDIRKSEMAEILSKINLNTILVGDFNDYNINDYNEEQLYNIILNKRKHNHNFGNEIKNNIFTNELVNYKDVFTIYGNKNNINIIPANTTSKSGKTDYIMVNNDSNIAVILVHKYYFQEVINDWNNIKENDLVFELISDHSPLVCDFEFIGIQRGGRRELLRSKEISHRDSRHNLNIKSDLKEEYSLRQKLKIKPESSIDSKLNIDIEQKIGQKYYNPLNEKIDTNEINYVLSNINFDNIKNILKSIENDIHLLKFTNKFNELQRNRSKKLFSWIHKHLLKKLIPSLTIEGNGLLLDSL